MNKGQFLLFNDLPECEKSSALSMFVNAHADDGYIYELDSDGVLVFRFRAGGFYDFLSRDRGLVGGCRDFS
jgi:hypothetical protein